MVNRIELKMDGVHVMRLCGTGHQVAGLGDWLVGKHPTWIAKQLYTRL